jgi:NADP-dependent aldehyde dehydrogenase
VYTINKDLTIVNHLTQPEFQKVMSNTPTLAPILINGSWKQASASGTFSASNPATGEELPDCYPLSTWADLDKALWASALAFDELRTISPAKIADFLRTYADLIEERGDAICEKAAEETGLAYSPRLRVVELGRTCNQLRQAADAAVEKEWRQPICDSEANIRSVLEPIGPVVVFGPNNFPLAFNGISGGDFVSAIAAGNPVLAKAHPNHPCTSRLLAECAKDALEASGLPPATVQMIYAMANEDGLRLVRDDRIGASAFTGSRKGGLALKSAADAAGKPIFLEMSSINPVVFLKGSLEERCDDLSAELTTSALMAAGQFCTNPGLIVVEAGKITETFIGQLTEKYAAAPCSTLLSKAVQSGLEEGTQILVDHGSELLTGGRCADQKGYAFANTLLRVDAKQFLTQAKALQTEVFGNLTLIVVAETLSEIEDVLGKLEGNLTGCIYSAKDGRDDEAYVPIATILRQKVGRLLNDKMPTGVAVSPAMNHGGPFPATANAHFTAVGLPASLKRFTQLASYDNVRTNRLPKILRD